VVVLAIAASSIFYGPLSDAVGRRRVMVTSLGLLAVATLLCALPNSFGALLALRGLQGLLVPGMSAVAVAYAGDRLPPSELGRAVAGIIAASVVGGLLGRVGSGLVASVSGWRGAFVVFAGLTALATAVCRGGLVDDGRRTASGGLGAATRGLWAHLTNPPLLGAYLVGFTLLFGWSGVFTYLPYLLSGPPHGLSTGAISSVYLVYAAGVVASPVAGRLSARVGSRRLVALGLGTAALGILLTLAAPLAVVVAGLAVLVLGMFTAQAVVPAFVNATARHAKGSAGGLYLSAYYLGGTLGASLPGLAWERLGWPGVVACCTVALGLAALTNATLCGLPPRDALE
jgi:YNFM family putative membrane transporter